ncbi:hypothetical protein AAHE18_08G054600 [Arachis hypogaea]
MTRKIIPSLSHTHTHGTHRTPLSHKNKTLFSVNSVPKTHTLTHTATTLPLFFVSSYSSSFCFLPFSFALSPTHKNLLFFFSFFTPKRILLIGDTALARLGGYRNGCVSYPHQSLPPPPSTLGVSVFPNGFF